MEKIELCGDKALDEVNARMVRVLPSVVGIFGLSDDGRAIVKGTGVLVLINSRRFIFTANHVVKGTIHSALQTTLCLNQQLENSDTVMQCFLPPARYDISSCRIEWFDTGLDVAALSIPELIYIEENRFVDGEYAATVTRKYLKPQFRNNSDDKSVPFIVTGYPNFGAEIDFDNRCHLLSCVSLFAEVSSWDATCHFDLSSVDLPLTVCPDHSPWDKHIEQVAHSTESKTDNEGFGGISGGPIFCVERDIGILSAITTQGGRIFGSHPRVIASSWDNIYDAFCLKIQ